ncbi:YhcN/YlaJ family sporulation lipoprotein [Alkalihalobacterium chitinilyticum]|uniref:YhcN/YlaJ family sporulation lipoprotein n=1 Tax=Alkalihalobacterium chitinilyticum TaxID=2980103 RepID=A0ABT5VAY0_9BACI|nr:YhcN/YlaJ family sporulation lipoprotein [Alkalihalobacterium chitinilyticum]MDE5411837.1 YhcN/YlaJ family sporulation lipoprotein [Alkalihalobacterium chitinilyticum]
MKKLTSVIVMLMLLLAMFSGCGVVEQKHPMGANHFREEGFSGFGTNRARNHEGPLSDMMVPDGVPKGRTDRAQPIAQNNMYYTSERNLGFKTQGTNRSGARIYNNIPNTIRGKYVLGDRPHLRHKQMDNEKLQTLDTNDSIRQRLLAIENINEVYVLPHEGVLLIGIESPEQNRPKLIQEVEEELSEVVDLDRVRIAIDRRNVNRIRAVLEGNDIAEPFQGIGGQLSEIRKNVFPRHE